MKHAIETQFHLNHPNCHKCYGVCIESKLRIIVVMEGVKCVLEDITTKREFNSKLSNDYKPSQLDMNEKIRIIKEIAEGLDYIHTSGLIHGDIRVGFLLFLLPLTSRLVTL